MSKDEEFDFFEEPTEEPTVEPTNERAPQKASVEPTGEPTVGTTEPPKSRGPPTKQIKEELDAFKAEVHAQLEEMRDLIKSTPGAPPVNLPITITEETILRYSKYILEQDPEIVPKTIKNAIVKNYRRPAEDYARSFVDFLKKEGILKPEA